jgi:hypothetical protein
MTAEDVARPGSPLPDMPFDGKRMIYCGFTPIVDASAIHRCHSGRKSPLSFRAPHLRCHSGARTK